MDPEIRDRVINKYSVPMRFELKATHLALLKRANVGWQDFAYEGAPGFDLKRPFGNSDVTTDLAEIITGMKDDDTADSPFHYDKEGDLKYVVDRHGDRWTVGDLWRVYRELETALQVILATQSFELGWYVRPDRYHIDSWQKEVETDA